MSVSYTHLLCGVTELAAQLVDPSITVNATANWYFMIVSVFMLTAVGVAVNKYFIVPRLGKYDPANGETGAADASGEITPIQAGALRAAGIFSIAYIAPVSYTHLGGSVDPCTGSVYSIRGG